jgi:hypothetical protein
VTLRTPWLYLQNVLDLRYHPSMKSAGTDESATQASNVLPFPAPEEDSTLIKTIGWISAGLGAVALGLFIGRELRQRYKFNRRTPYDFYAHSGDAPEQDVDYGLGT